MKRLKRALLILMFTLVALLVVLKFKASDRPTYFDSGPDIDRSKLEGLDKGNIEQILQDHGR